MTQKTVLVVEDEKKLARLLQEYLEQAGYATHCLHDGNQVEPWLDEHQADLLILDLMLPGVDGVTLCRQIRSHSSIPIIMASAKVTEDERLTGLDTGADDYLCKPYSLREMVARVNALFRRSEAVLLPPDRSANQQIGLFSCNSETMSIQVHGHLLNLTLVEFRLLNYLLHNPDVVFSRDELLNQIYSDYRLVTDRTVDTHIKNLRRKIQQIIQHQEVILSIYGVGYKLLLPT
ncbi:response regulator [Neptunomonas antarctica]|nr:response regulator [Neptunomonas antarctica]